LSAAACSVGRRRPTSLSVEITTPTDIPTRVDIVRRRDSFERDPVAFTAEWASHEHQIRKIVADGRKRLAAIEMPDAALERASQLSLALGTDGLRGELSLIRAARAIACLKGDNRVNDDHLRKAAPSALRHRLRRDPLDDAGSTARIDRTVEEVFAS
jgi:magnesium chelatase subunit I